MPVAQEGVQIRHELLERLADARVRSDDLFDLVKPEFLYTRPIPERHRIIFYVGHLEAFDWNLMGTRVFRLRPSQPEFDRLFAFGIDPVGGGLPTDQPSDWPSLGDVRGYVNQVRETLDQNLRARLSSGSQSKEQLEFPLSQLLNVAIEHRLMHVETLAYMLHQLPLDQKVRRSYTLDKPTGPISKTMIPIPAGVATLGISREQGMFGWDNEYERHSVDVPSFSVDRFMVSNGQYLEFMSAQGYDNQALWSRHDWDWRAANEISHPVFWRRRGDGWYYRTMFEDIPLPLDWPVYVSQAEASAYARWANKVLPTEAQWHRAAYGTPEGSEREYPWGNTQPATQGNFDFRRWDPAPVNAFPAGDSAFGASGLLGNGWEWTSTEFAPFQGFQPFPFYPGYSADFFDGKHYVMKGGSPRTAACMLRRSFRNWFQPRYQYVYAGFRCVSK